MKIHKAKLLDVIQYTGEEPRIVRELMTNPLPTVNKGDLLIVPEKVAKFLSRAGSPFEKFEIEDLISDTDENYVNHIADDAVAKVNQLNQTVLELESQSKIKQDELEAIELRENKEMEELKKLNQKLNEQLENSSNSKKTTTKAPKEETL
ncbi:hypothetical protein PT520_09685 [Aliarcobacter butzleri]|uniref:KfrA N-terminal DNA-binding domain-containing protein n=1 Tax=Aliarcobacter butzleri TaxID=28197 RepID=A0AAW6VQD5_9BACT|nr:hypothetical protein [Aliarcobacter butzleri]MDK2062787.1 hypothetical protein [Aliarcobacter butzleri]